MNSREERLQALRRKLFEEYDIPVSGDDEMVAFAVVVAELLDHSAKRLELAEEQAAKAHLEATARAAETVMTRAQSAASRAMSEAGKETVGQVVERLEVLAENTSKEVRAQMRILQRAVWVAGACAALALAFAGIAVVLLALR